MSLTPRRFCFLLLKKVKGSNSGSSFSLNILSFGSLFHFFQVGARLFEAAGSGLWQEGHGWGLLALSSWARREKEGKRAPTCCPRQAWLNLLSPQTSSCLEPGLEAAKLVIFWPMALTLFPRYTAPGRALFLSTGDTLPPLISNAAVVRLVGWSPRQKAGRQQLTQGGPPTPHLPPPAAQLLAPKLRPESVSPFQPQRCFLLALGAASLRAGIALTVYNTCTHSPSHTHTQLRGV